MNYREIASASLERAKELLQDKQQHQYRYAALELRMALEALVYQRAGNYAKEINSDALNTWQPRKLLAMLLEIDPDADKSSSVSVGLPGVLGEEPSAMHSLGEHRVLSMQQIKRYYDRIGSFLHTPTRRQMETLSEWEPKLLKSCNELCAVIDKVLASPLTDLDFRLTAELACHRCKEVIIRRLPSQGGTVVARCANCDATYNVTSSQASSDVIWEPRLKEIPCANPECKKVHKLWRDEIKPDARWNCGECHQQNKIVLVVTSGLIQG